MAITPSSTADQMGLQTTAVSGSVTVAGYTGRIGNAAYFNGASSISVPTIPNSYWQGPFTVVWIESFY